jgi:hypothetical protein
LTVAIATFATAASARMALVSGSAPASTSTTWAIAAATASSVLASGPATAIRKAMPGVHGVCTSSVTPPNSDSAMRRTRIPARRAAIACPTSWATIDIIVRSAAAAPPVQ